MAKITSRQALAEWALRKLGHPVIRINVDPQQIEDRIDEALYLFETYHLEGTQRVFFQHEITASVLTFTAPLIDNFQTKEIFIGSTSNAEGRFLKQADDNLSLEFVTIKGQFEVGETITGQVSNATGVIDTITIGDIDNGYITLPDSILSISRILKMQSSGNYLFNVRYHYALNTIPSLMGFDLIGFDMLNKHMALLDHILSPAPTISFSRTTNRLYINLIWGTDLNVGDKIVMEVSYILDPADFGKIYGNDWVRNYVVALIRQQWAQNLGKYRNIQLPGGVTMDVDSMKSQAEEELKNLLEELELKYQIPAFFIVG